MSALDWLDAAVLAMLGLMILLGIALWAVCLIAIRRKMRDWAPFEVWIAGGFVLAIWVLASLA